MVMICSFSPAIKSWYFSRYGPNSTTEKKANPSYRGIRSIMKRAMTPKVRSTMSMIQWTIRKIRSAFRRLNMFRMMITVYIWYYSK